MAGVGMVPTIGVLIYALMICKAAESNTTTHEPDLEGNQTISPHQLETYMEDYPKIDERISRPTTEITTTLCNLSPKTLCDSDEMASIEIDISKILAESKAEGNADICNDSKPSSSFQNNLEQNMVEIEGVKYLDISSINVSKLRLCSEDGIAGITVSDGQKDCIVEDLELLQGFIVSKNVTQCSSLRKLVLKGGKWKCVCDWSWLDEDYQSLQINYAEAKCKDIRLIYPKNKSYSTTLFEVRQLLGDQPTRDCPSNCSCSLRVNHTSGVEVGYWIDCDYQGFTDETLPTFPSYTTSLTLRNNKLTSTENVFEKIIDLVNLTQISLNYNQLDAFPYLEDGTYPKLVWLHLDNNNISQIDLEAFESIVKRENIIATIFNNTFPCDCSSHFLMKIYIDNYHKVGRFPLWCTGPPDYVPTRISLNPKKCEPRLQTASINPHPYIIGIFTVLNLVAIFFLCDLLWTIRESRKSTQYAKEPKIHLFLTSLEECAKMCCKNPLRMMSRNLEESRINVQDEVPVVLRSRPDAIVHFDRLSVVRRSERRLTPGPGET